MSVQAEGTAGLPGAGLQLLGCGDCTLPEPGRRRPGAPGQWGGHAAHGGGQGQTPGCRGARCTGRAEYTTGGRTGPSPLLGTVAGSGTIGPTQGQVDQVGLGSGLRGREGWRVRQGPADPLPPWCRAAGAGQKPQPLGGSGGSPAARPSPPLAHLQPRGCLRVRALGPRGSPQLLLGLIAHTPNSCSSPFFQEALPDHNRCFQRVTWTPTLLAPSALGPGWGDGETSLPTSSLPLGVSDPNLSPRPRGHGYVHPVRVSVRPRFLLNLFERQPPG